MMNFYSVLLFFFIFGLFKVNSCDCCKGNKSSGSDSSDAKSGSPLIDISGKTIEEFEILKYADVRESKKIDSYDENAFNRFFKTKIFNLNSRLVGFACEKKIRIFFKKISFGCNEVITFMSSDVVSSFGFDVNHANLHKLNDKIYYFYYRITNDIILDNNDNVFANLDISKLKWYD